MLSKSLIGPLLISVGLFMAIMPLVTGPFNSLTTSPHIPENEYSHGIVADVNPSTGKYYLYIQPKSDKGVELVSASLKFQEADKVILLPIRNVITSNADYDHYQFWYETNIVSDGLLFNHNYTIIYTVTDKLGRKAYADSWILFHSENGNGNLPVLSENKLSSYVTFLGIGTMGIGVVIIVAQSKKLKLPR